MGKILKPDFTKKTQGYTVEHYCQNGHQDCDSMLCMDPPSKIVATVSVMFVLLLTILSAMAFFNLK